MIISRTTAAVTQVADCLRAGGVVLIPTDTVYGLAALPTANPGVSRIFALKNRPGSQNLPIMISAPGDIGRLGGTLNAASSKLLASKFFPGPLTLALGVDADIRAEWLRGRDEAAFRMPDDEWLLKVLRQTGPLLVTSANVHAEAPKEAVPEILASLTGTPDLAVDGGVRTTTASTLVNCRAVPPVVERIGVVPRHEIEAILQ